jgi:lipoprotein NlpD
MNCRIVILFSCFLLLGACVSEEHYAPVYNAWKSPYSQNSHYRVKKGDTLYSISWAFGLDYRDLAAANGLSSPYAISVGQSLNMYVGKKKAPVKVLKISLRPSWQWPTQGRVVDGFSLARAGNKGVNIAGKLGQPVRASASGRVVYSGDGVRGYGNLIIIKHNDNFLSAYAFNERLLVSVGMSVRAGQVIATMGRDDDKKVLLHFEIRRDGRPVDPLRFLA